MNAYSLLDCTLREAPLEDHMWGKLSYRKIIENLGRANVEFIECGYLKNPSEEDGDMYFHTVEQLCPYLPSRKTKTKYALLVDYGRYDLKWLSNNDKNIIDLIRICFKKNEIKEVIPFARKIQEKGYPISIQHVDTIAYSKDEILDFLREVNQLHPFSYSLVDTFGSMYAEDLLALCDLVDKNLDKGIRLGFHSHNNMMLANANSQVFLNAMQGKRELIVDASLFGCGRGAGNANTELMAEYLNKKKGGSYDVNILLDLIDTVINAAKKKATWGYSIPYFISGMNDTHPFNVKYLSSRHNIHSSDLRAIIQMLDESQKKKYDYDILDKIYVSYFSNATNDQNVIEMLKRKFADRTLLLLAPGKTLRRDQNKIRQFIMQNNPVVIGVNNLLEHYKQDIVFFSGIRRYELLPFQDRQKSGNPIVIKTSNISSKIIENELVVDYASLIKSGWTYMDSSIILLLRLLAKCAVKHIEIAGLDGYKTRGNTFSNEELETALSAEERHRAMTENMEMLQDFHKEHPNITIHFLTKSNYEKIFK